MNEQGQLIVTGPSMAIGYLGNKEATDDTFRDGWVYTGDDRNTKVVWVKGRLVHHRPGFEA